MIKLVFGLIILIIGLIFARIYWASVDKCKKEIQLYHAKLEDPKTDAYDKRSLKEKLETTENFARSQNRIQKIILIAALAVSAVLIGTSFVAVVPTGYTGIKTTFGKVENDTLPSGFNIILPWQNVINMDNREQRSAFSLEAFSKDIQQVDVMGSINYNIDKSTAMNLYKDVGVEYPTILVSPRVLEDVKIVLARYTAERLVESRQDASDAIYDLIKKELAEKGINVISFAIENLDFTDAFESAVEAKQVATQEKQKAQTEQEKQTMEMQQKAERDRIQAQAAADVQKIEADAKAYAIEIEAQAKAKANKEISATLSESLIKYNLINQWNGLLPTTTLGEGTNVLFSLAEDKNNND